MDEQVASAVNTAFPALHVILQSAFSSWSAAVVPLIEYPLGHDEEQLVEPVPVV